MGLARNSATRRAQVQRNNRIYFSNLGEADLSGLNLSNKCFYGCVLSGSNLSGSALVGCAFENCFIEEDQLPTLDGVSIEDISIENCNFTFVEATPRISLARNVWPNDVIDAISAAMHREPDRLSEAIRQRVSSGDSRDMSAMLSLCAVLLSSARWEHRQSSLSILSEALLRNPQLLDPMREAYLAVLLYRTGDPSDMVYHQALDLLEIFAPDDSVLAHLFSRMESQETSERKEALVGARRILARYPCDTSFPIDALERLLADPEQPSDIVREALRTLSERLDTLATEQDVPQDPFTPALTRLFEHGDERILREALRVVSRFYGWEGRARIRSLLSDRSEDIRNRAFMTLYRIMPADEFLELLKEHPPSASCQADIVANQAYLRENGWANGLISDEDLRPLLTSDEVQARKEGLYYSSFLGDDRYRQQLMDGLEHNHPDVRVAALRAVKWLNPPPTRDELEFLEHDPDESVRRECANLLSSISSKP